MRITELRLLEFKRFHDLTINLSTKQTKVVALVGVNGSGKSSVFDAFENLAGETKGNSGRKAQYFKKSLFHDANATPDYNLNRHVS